MWFTTCMKINILPCKHSVGLYQPQYWRNNFLGNIHGCGWIYICHSFSVGVFQAKL